MRLVIKRGQVSVGEMEFSKGPVYIGRQVGSQVFLPDRAVSRQHAVLHTGKDGGWIVEDLDSANKTFLNDKAIYKSGINHGDVVKVGDFTIQVTMEKEASGTEEPINLGDTVTPAATTSAAGVQTIVRKIEGSDAQSIRMPAKRVRDMEQLVEAIGKVAAPDKLATELNEIMLKQFTAFHAFTAFRFEANGPMQIMAGKKKNTEKIDLGTLKLKDAILNAAEKHEYTLIPRISWQADAEQIRSAMIVPVMYANSCNGVIYLANRIEHEHYTISDIDYLILLSIHIGAVLQKFAVG